MPNWLLRARNRVIAYSTVVSVVAGIFTSVAAPAVYASGGTVRNANISVGLDVSNGITVTSIHDQVTGHEYLTQSGFLFEFAINNGVPYQSNNGVVVDSSSFAGDGSSATIAAHATNVSLSFALTLTAAAGDSGIVVQTTLTNTGSSAASLRLVYPKLLHFATAGQLANMMGAIPQEIGSVSNLNNVSSLGMGLNLTLGLPTAMDMMEVADVFDGAGGGGLFFADLDGDTGRGVPPLQFNASKTEIDGFWTANLKASVPVSLPRLAIGVHHSGDWHAAVDYYVNAHKANWTFPDTPAWLREQAAIYSPTAGGSGGIYLYQQPQATLASRMTSFTQLPQFLTEAQSVGTNVIYLNDFWEGVSNPQNFPPYFNKGDYTPRNALGGAPALVAGIAALHAQGGRVIAYVEPYIIYQLSQIASQHGTAWAGRDASGNLDQTFQYYYTMVAPFTPWQDQLISISQRLVGQYGFDGIFLDSSGWQMNKTMQTSSEAVMYTSQQWSEGVLRMVDRVRASIRAIKSDAVVLSETTSGPLAFHLDGGVSADFAWLSGQNNGQIVASPVRYAMPNVDIFSNGAICAQANPCNDEGVPSYSITNAQHLNQLNQIYAAGHGLALSQLELTNASYVKQLVGFRQTYKDALIYGNQSYQPASGNGTVPAFFFQGTVHQMITVANTSTSSYSGNLALASGQSNSTWRDLLTNSTFAAAGTQLPVTIAGQSMLVLLRTDTTPSGPPPTTYPITSYDPTLLNANFDDGKLFNWWTVHDGNWSNPGTYVQASTTTTGGTLLYDRRTGDDFSYAGDVTIVSGGEAGLSFRLSDNAGQGYDAILSRIDGGVKLAKRPYAVLGRYTMPINLNQTYRVQVGAHGSDLSVSINGTMVISVNDASYASGRFGLTNFQSTANFDNLLASEPALTASGGLSAYRQLGLLPYLNTGSRERQFSSFDRTGGNADLGNFLTTASDGPVLAEHQGPGEVDAIWGTGGIAASGNNLKVILDGVPVINAPFTTVVNGGLGGAFQYPLVANDSQSSGGFYTVVPMQFKKSMRITTTGSASPYYYHVTYRTFADATNIVTFNPASAADDVLTLLQEAGTQDPKGSTPGATSQYGTYQVVPGQSAVVAQASGSGEVVGVQLRIPHLTHPTTTPLNDDGRAFGAGGSSAFAVALDPNNTGIQIIRRFDPSIGNQKANILIDGTQQAQWLPLAAVPTGQWADQTVTIPPAATAGKSRTTITNVFVSSDVDFNEFMYSVWQQVGGVWHLADTVDVGPEHTLAERAHSYIIIGQTWSGDRTFSYPLPGSITSGGDAFGSGGSNHFVLTIDRNNNGVRLTRRLDPEIGQQVASVTVDGTAVGSWVANPTQSPSFADESIELPASTTAGKTQITVTNTFVSSSVDFNEFFYWVDNHMPGGLEQTDTFDVGSSASQTQHSYGITGQTWSGTRTFSYANSDQLLTQARIRISFDGTQTVDTPLSEFFASAGGEFDTRSLMASIDVRSNGWLSSWWPMPYGSSVSVSLYNGSGVPLLGEVALTTATASHWQTDLNSGVVGYFHATSSAGAAVTGQDWLFLQTTGHGKVVGIVQGVTFPTDGTNAHLFLEGDERAYTDGSLSPEIPGTGTEDFYHGGWYFTLPAAPGQPRPSRPFTMPLNGNPSHEESAGNCPAANTACYGMYRLLIADAVTFNSSITFGIEHGETDNRPGNETSTALWYGQAAAVTAQSDTLTMGDTNSESAHHLTPGNPGSVSSLTDTYEGNDGTQINVTHNVRYSGVSYSFTMAVSSSNHGVVLQRTSDQQTGYQGVEIVVNGTDLGKWLQPCANTYHRWLDDDFLIPGWLTAGQSQLTISLTPINGAPAWSAASYRTVSLTS